MDKTEFLKKKAEFVRSVQPFVNVLAKEFEMRKSATAYRKVSVSKTGVIDTNKLHQYKLTEDIFKRATNTPDGKNHGVFVMIDFSGSMNNSINGAIKQALVLSMFCKKIGVPFKVCSFTDNYSAREVARDKAENISMDSRRPEFCLREYLSSDLNKKDYDMMFDYCVLMATGGHSYYSTNKLRADMLSGTPLDESILMARQVVLDFKKKHRIEKMTSIFITDGETTSYTDCYHAKGYGYDKITKKTFTKNFRVSEEDKLRNTFIGAPSSRYANTAWALNVFKETTGSNMIGYFLLNRNEFKRTFRGFNDSPDLKDKILTSEFKDFVGKKYSKYSYSGGKSDYDSTIGKYGRVFNKTGMMALKDYAGYDMFFYLENGKALDTSNLDEGLDVDVDVNDNGSLTTGNRNKLIKGMNKSADNKRRNKVLANNLLSLLS